MTALPEYATGTTRRHGRLVGLRMRATRFSRTTRPSRSMPPRDVGIDLHRNDDGSIELLVDGGGCFGFAAGALQQAVAALERGEA